jgi:multimeric flavodoxin WrbA
MKIVSILGSPRPQGNSNAIVRRFQETAAKLGAENQTFELNRLTYRGCQGCHICKQTLERCVLNDALTEVLAAVAEADLVVLASPVYFGDVTSQLKGFIDRAYSYLKPDYLTNPEPSRIGPKKLLFVITQDHPFEDVYAEIFPRYDTFLKYLGFTETRQLRVCGIGPTAVDTVSDEVFDQADELAREFMGVIDDGADDEIE